MLKKTAVVLAGALLALLLFAATRPDSFRVERSLTIRAPPDRIYASIGDFHEWASWSPYEKLDPQMKRSFNGPSSGKGAVYQWAGNEKAGAGRMEILDATVPTRVTIKLDFLKPFEGHNTAEFTIVPQGDSSTVTWAMYGPSAYIHKLISLFLSMDQIVGKDFESGLANLKALTEK